MGKKLELLRQIRIGHRVAEDEKNELSKYFVKTSQWRKLENNEIDIVYGAKGTGKSALYALLTNNKVEFLGNKILLVPAEDPLGASVFQTLIDVNEPTENEIAYIWKLYILTLVVAEMRKLKINDAVTSQLVDALELAGLLPKTFTPAVLFARAKRYILSFSEKEPAEVEYSLGLDSDSGMPIATKKSIFRTEDNKKPLSNIPVNDLLAFANSGLQNSGYYSWVLFDRLDVAFAESPGLEKVALRSLFRVYSDIKPLENISAKIFVRKDIWGRITEGGFREASHVIKTDEIEWDRDGLLNLVINRLLNNKALVDYLAINKQDVIANLEKQETILERIFPKKIDTGKNPDTFDWILSRVQDGSKTSAPREVIHMLESVINGQIKRLEQGNPEPTDEVLLDRIVFKNALTVVSKVRYDQTLCAEYPALKPYLEKLRGEKAEQKIETLMKIWDEDQVKTQSIADQLVAAGFFEARAEKGGLTYWVPFLYRSALNLVRGKAGATKKSKQSV